MHGIQVHVYDIIDMYSTCVYWYIGILQYLHVHVHVIACTCTYTLYINAHLYL